MRLCIHFLNTWISDTIFFLSCFSVFIMILFYVFLYCFKYICSLYIVLSFREILGRSYYDIVAWSLLNPILYDCSLLHFCVPYLNTHTNIHVYTYRTNIDTYIYIYTHMCICIYIYLCPNNTYAYIYMFKFIFRKQI